MIVTVIKAAAVIAFFGITVGLIQPATNKHGNRRDSKRNTQQVCSECYQGTHQET